MTKQPTLRTATLCVHAGHKPLPGGSLAVPIFQTACYAFGSSSHAADLFSLEKAGDIYTRISNPTTTVFENRLAALEGGVGALATASGQAAVLTAIMCICSAGDEIISGTHIYGGTYTLLSSTLRRLGINTRFVDADDLGSVRSAVGERTKALFIESISNPRMSVPDIRAIADVAHESGLPLIVDNTFATPVLCRPFEHGADIVVHSTTKYIGGHGTSIGGAIVDSGNFDWGSGRFPEMTAPSGTYGGPSFVDRFGRAAFIARARLDIQRDLGACMSPFNAFLLLQGLETLHVRMERHSLNAMQVANYLELHPSVKWVAYPGLGSHQSYRNAARTLQNGFGGMLAFGITGGRSAGEVFADRLHLFTLAANLGDARSLVIHPASTTHQQLSREQQATSGVSEDLVRLSVGIEDVGDLIQDIEQALAAAVGVRS